LSLIFGFSNAKVGYFALLKSRKVTETEFIREETEKQGVEVTITDLSKKLLVKK